MMHARSTTRRPAAVLLAMASLLAGCACERVDSQPEPKPSPTPEAETRALPPMKENAVYVRLTTTMGDIVLELDPEKAPISTENFLAYVDAGSYDGTIFHRVMEGFMIQGGGFEPDMTQRPTRPTIKNEWQNGLANTQYTVAMARLGGRADSASSQFFINLADNPFLDEPRDGAGYAVFGRVFDGQDVVDRIALVATTTRSDHENVPTEPVIITSAQRVDE